MSFLELKPAARHLRRIAKAHAAGELPRQDYRRARRKIIEELHVDFSGSDNGFRAPFDQFSIAREDETRRRFPDDLVSSERSSESQVERAGLTPLTGGNRVWRARWLLVALFGLTILLASLAAAGAAIPLPDQRDPNPNNSRTFALDSLGLEEFAGLPQLSELEVREFLSEQLASALAEAGSENRAGLSEAELQELGDLLLRLGIQSEEGLDQSAIYALNALAQKQSERRGVSVVQLERIAERLELFFRERGYLAARAYVPAQEVVNGVAVLRVLPGRIGKITVGNDSSLADMVAEAFSRQQNSVAERSSLEAVFYKLNSLPGVRASGSLGAGETVGETHLDITLDSPRKLTSLISFDNFGDERSSRYRLKAHAEWLNPTSRGDSLNLNAALRVDPETANDFGARYETPVGRLGDTAAASYAVSSFDVVSRVADARVDGRSQTLDLGFKRMLVGSRATSLTIGATAAWQKLQFSEATQKLLWIAPELAAHKVLDASRWVLRGGLGVTAGQIASGRDLNQPSEFLVGEGWLSAWKPLGERSMRVDLAAQLGSKDLPDSHKFRLGGVRRNLALRPGGFVADSAILAGLEIVATPKAWRSYGDLKFFTRMSHGHVQISGNRESAFVWDGGVAWQLPLIRQYSGSFRLSFPLVTNGIEDSHENARFLFDLTWRP